MRLQALIAEKPLARVAGNEAFEMALARGGAALFANLQFQAAIKAPEFLKVMGDPDFRAALADQAALQAALGGRQR